MMIPPPSILLLHRNIYFIRSTSYTWRCRSKPVDNKELIDFYWLDAQKSTNQSMLRVHTYFRYSDSIALYIYIEQELPNGFTSKCETRRILSNYCIAYVIYIGSFIRRILFWCIGSSIFIMTFYFLVCLCLINFYRQNE